MGARAAAILSRLLDCLSLARRRQAPASRQFSPPPVFPTPESIQATALNTYTYYLVYRTGRGETPNWSRPIGGFYGWNLTEPKAQAVATRRYEQAPWERLFIVWATHDSERRMAIQLGRAWREQSRAFQDLMSA